VPRNGVGKRAEDDRNVDVALFHEQGLVNHDVAGNGWV